MIKRNIPNIFTLANLLCGCLSIVYAFNDNLIVAAYFIGIASVFDFLDGFFARILKAYSDFGKQLDSLSDLVSFGLAPAVIMFQLMLHAIDTTNLVLFDVNILPFIAFFITLFSALRLAKFNIDIRQTENFIGLPTPANAILIASLPLIIMQCADTSNTACIYAVGILNNFYFLSLLTFLMSAMLVIEIDLFSLKFKHFKWQGNKSRYLFLLLSVVFLVLFCYLGIPLILFFYILLSLSSKIL